MLRFEWDPAKARTNRGKHHVSFDDAMLVFEDPCALFERDLTCPAGKCAGGRWAWLAGSSFFWWSTPRERKGWTRLSA